MSDNLPAPVRPHDEAAARSIVDPPELNAVQTVTKEMEAAVAIGNGDADEMESSGEWIQADLFTAWTQPRRLQ